MSENAWVDQIAAERMQTDQEFTEEVATSPLSSQQWGLVMTAVEFQIDGAAQPETAQLVADTGKLSSVMPELRRMEDRGGGGISADNAGTAASSGGLLDGIKGALGLGGGQSDALQAAAEELVGKYTDRLQSRLDERGRWAEVCEQAQES
ncbi:hypothetical protein Hrd1104_06170 [Halorhabdus sp. CBA1104]|uniref:DUF5799 family protein n=1 Tax=unclassified Halorhabdus TaxID=2621901 RepID=UPI0012B28E69|nr:MULTISPECIES: DUF5799 family protein [unclassified Halorhabdus]QGN06919.1 hypothetical protein Hrd1104_06170 [Halorhabdus sp. CBA1104]